MPTTCVIGIQWGDEGKGKIIDLVSEKADLVVRYQGGANAGHTVVLEGETYFLHLIPSGILHPGKTCLIANGVAVDPQQLVREIVDLEARGIVIGDRLKLSHLAHLVLPYHKRIDALEERQRAGGALGTTGRGIGPCYQDKVSRRGLRVADVLDPRRFEEKLRRALEEKNRVLERLYDAEPMAWEEVRDEVLPQAARLAPLACDCSRLLNAALDRGRFVFFEGAQGTLLDIDFGTYPFVTSSNACTLGIAAGAGVSPKRIENVLGVAKAYTTRVGEGPFPTELTGATGDRLRDQGQEYGTTTGRPRRCGWFDGVAARFAVRLNGVDHLALTKFDVLGGFPVIHAAVAYRLHGRETDEFPTTCEELLATEPVYRTFDGWEEDLSGIRRPEDLPRAARTYLEFLEDFLRVRISTLSVGKGREQTILTR